MIRYGATGELVNASVSLVLGFIRDASVLLQQDFQVTFVQVQPPILTRLKT